MNIIADTCFWISLCDKTQSNHDEMVQILERIVKDGRHSIVVPHPVLYETLCTDFVKKYQEATLLTKLYFPLAAKISDADYLEEAYRTIEMQSCLRNGTASMVDVVIMLMVEKRENNIGAVLTTNGRDFGVFCQKHCIPMIDSLAVFQAI